MPIFVDPKTGEQFENNEPNAAAAAQRFGFVTQEQYDAEQRSGGLGSRVATAGEEAIRQAGAVASLIPGVDAGAAPAGLTELEPGQASNPLTDVYGAAARERRDVNPASAGIGASLPAVGASLLLPGSGVLGLATTIGVDTLSGYSQAAVDAELEGRAIDGSDVLRNAGTNLAFSLPLYGLGAAGHAFLGSGRGNTLERAASAARDTAGRRAAAAEGADLAQAVADPAVQSDLLERIAMNTDDAVARAHDRVGSFTTPVVARNPNAQRAAVGAIADVERAANPDLAARLDALTKGASKKRLEGLRAIRDELASAGESDALTAIDAVIGREDLWGSKAIRGASDIDAVLGARPGPGAPPEELIDYANRVRSVRGGELGGIADEIEQLAERQIEVRTAAAIGDTGARQAANETVDYAAAMRDMTPEEAWRLTRDGADDGLRQLESTSVSDAMQRVDDVLREDVAMAVKREDFVKGAESWTPAVVAKQNAWADQMRGRAMALAGKLSDAETAGYRIGGFRAEATSLIDRAVQRLADGDAITVNAEWDGLKRGLDSLAKRLAATGPAIDDASKSWGSKAILELSDDLRKGLEDSELWGRNAGLQKETNAAWTKVIEPYSRVTKKMAEFLGRDFGVVGQAGIKRRFDPDMIDSIMSRGYQRNLRADVDASIRGLDQMMQARQAQGLSHLDRLSQARADLVRIREGFDAADVLAVAKSKAKAPLGLEIAQRVAGSAAPGGLVSSVVGPVTGRIGNALVGDLPLIAPGSNSQLARVVRRHIGLNRAEQAAMLADPAFTERLPGSLQRQIMAGSAATDKTVELAQTAADAAKRDRDLTARLMVNPEDAKRAKKAQRSTPAIDRARARATQSGHVDISGKSPLDVRMPDEEGYLEPVTARDKRMKKVIPEIREFSERGLVGKSLEDLGALPIDDPAFPDATKSSREKIAWMKGDPTFRREGNLPGNNDRARGGLPSLTLEDGGAAYLSNGRHRFTAAREGEQEFMVANVKRVDADGNTVWDWVGPVRVNPPPAVPRGGERGMVDIGSSVAKSPLGVGTAAATAVVGYHELAKPADPESMTPLQRFSEGYERPSDAFRAARKMMQGWAQNPEGLVDMIVDDMGAVGQLSPKLEREMTAQAMRIVSYLQDNMPGQRNVSVVYPDGTPPSRAEVRQFALRFQAATDPASVMADARAGRLERTQLDTLQAVWPREYDALRAGVIQELGAGQASPRTRQRMSLLFSFPSGVDPALGPRTRGVVAAARAEQEAKAPASRSPGMNRQRLPSTATMQPAGMAALGLGQQIGSP
jgi:hypothetical protein